MPNILSPYATWAYSWIRPQPRDVDLPLEHGDLVAQDHDLDVLGAIGSGEQGKPAEHPERHEISEPWLDARHGPGSFARMFRAPSSGAEPELVT